ncbi:hypothetical protein [Capnocytophaga catalasegens]|nr:hypothetical protein [Capnocytophaga catalasegens]GJM49312.1 hypothetical protein RCZ15_02870 [Capnocytophaga catalasegens]
MMVLITSCNRDFEKEKEAPQIHQNTEDNYKATTINLWGSPADVIDTGDSYIFQGDVIIKKEDLHIFEKDSMGLPLSASAARVERKWPDNKVYYALNNISAANKRIFIEAISEIQEKTYLTFYERYNESKTI